MSRLQPLLRLLRWSKATAAPAMSIERLPGTPDRYRITASDPQTLLMKWGRPLRLRPGRYRLELRVAPDSDALVRPKIYMNYGHGFPEKDAFHLAKTGPHQWSREFHVASRAVQVRLDPSEAAHGEFDVQRLSVLPLGRGSAAAPLPAVNRTVFCAAPYVQSLVTTAGDAKPCAVFLSANPPSARLDAEPFWNSAELRLVRRQMTHGLRPRQCRTCHTREEAGVLSARQVVNRAWEELGWGNPLAESLEDLAAQASPEFTLARGPAWMELNLSNLCNLRCRMCSPASSSRVASDPVQARWTPDESDLSRLRRYNQGDRWLTDPSFFRDVIGADLSNLTKLELKGGEPLLIKPVAQLLRRLIDIGRSAEVELVMVTNGTIAPEPMLKFLEQFRHLTLIVSVDGVGDLNDYIRDGARWNDIVDNINSFKSLKNATVSMASTIQAYNMMSVVEIGKFAANNGFDLSCNMLRSPAYLSCFAMPAAARAEAAARIRAHLAETSTAAATTPSTMAALAYVATCLETEEADQDTVSLLNFKKYTQDLDHDRNQDFSSIGKDLLVHLQ